MRHPLLLPLVLSATLLGCSRKDASQALPPADPSAAAPVSSLLKTSSERPPQEARSKLSASGTTYAIHQASLSARSSGVIVRLNVEAGDRVKKGQLLFQVDGRGAALGVAQAQVGLKSAEINLKGAKEDLDRKEGLAKTGSVTEAALVASRLQYDAAELGVKQARVALSNAQFFAGETSVRAPFDGVIAEKHLNQGESVGAMAQPVLLVQDISKLEVRARLPENALATLRPGSPATAHFRSIDRTVQVTIKRISPSVDMRTRTIEVVCELDNPEEVYKAGMLVELDFTPRSEASPGPAAPAPGATTAAQAPPPAPAGAGQ
ncbi:MAG: efflux RND transporter periplasmic adaptor subunit [Polyangiaceae bacterium]|nr:efflux RND transporter periplasmic adaptor subunit [Polyangiaceae bacterium]